MIQIDETFHWVRDKSTGKVSIGRRFRFDGSDRGWFWEVMLPGWHDYESERDFNAFCDAISDIKPMDGD